MRSSGHDGGAVGQARGEDVGVGRVAGNGREGQHLRQVEPVEHAGFDDLGTGGQPAPQVLDEFGAGGLTDGQDAEADHGLL